MLAFLIAFQLLASLACATVMRSIPVLARFDDLPKGTSITGVPVPTPYRYLHYSAFAVGTPVRGGLGLQTTSPPNAILAPYILTGLLSSATITRAYKGSTVHSFDLQSCAAGCFAATNNGLADPAINCTIRFTGIKAGGNGGKVTKDFFFGVRNPTGISPTAFPIQTVTFGAGWRGLKSVSVKVQKAVVPEIANATVQMGFDDFKYVVHTNAKAE